MPNDYEKRLLRVLEHIHDNPAGDLSLDALADVAALSRFHFHRVFRALLGETTAQAVRRIRLARASALLVQSEEPIPSIARSIGYPNQHSFARAYGEFFGMTPAAFRNRGELRPIPRNQPQKVTIMHPVTIRDEGSRRLAAVPHSGPYIDIGRAFERLSAILGARGQFGGGRMVGVFYDDPSSVAPDALRSHAGYEIAGFHPIEAPLETITLHPGRHAVMTYTGPYAGLHAAYDQFYSTWLPKSGEEPADQPPFEVYLNTPMTAAPEELVTEIHMPLKG